MKKLFFGLLVAGVALSASAFTNAKPNLDDDTVYITAKVTDPTTHIEYYEFQSGPTGTCNSTISPCRVTTLSYPLPTSAPFRFPVSDYNSSNFDVSATTFQPAL